MKKKLLLGVAAFALAVGGFALVAQSNNTAVQTNAEKVVGGKKYYFDLTNEKHNWLANSAVIKVWSWGGSTSDAFTETAVVSGSVYCTTIPSDRTGLQLVRYDSAGVSELNRSENFSNITYNDFYKVDTGDNFSYFAPSGLYKTATYDMYFICDGKWAQAYAHVYDGCFDQFGAWPGAVMDRNGAVVDFKGGDVDAKAVGNIWKVTIRSDYAGHVIFNNNDGAQTSAFVTTNGGVYHYGLAADSTGESDDDLVAAVKLIYDLETARNAVTEVRVEEVVTIRAYSICGIDSITRGNLISRYNGLSVDAKKMVDDSKTTTYNGENPAGDQIQVTFKDIFAELKTLAGAGAYTISWVDQENSAPIVPIAIVAAVAAVSVGGFFLLRKKKAE